MHSCTPLCSFSVRQSEHGIHQPAAEGFIVTELLVEFGVIPEYSDHHLGQRLVVLDARVLAVGVLLGILIGRIGRDLRRNVLGDQPVDAVRIGPGDVAKLVVERLEDVAQEVEFGLGSESSGAGRHWLDLGILVGQGDTHGGLFFRAVAVHVNSFEDASGKVLFYWRRQLGNQEGQEDGEFLPLGVCVRQDRPQEVIGAGEGFGFAFEAYLAILVKFFVVGYAGIQNRVESVAVSPTQV